MTAREPLRLDSTTRSARYIYRTERGARVAVSASALRLLAYRDEGWALDDIAAAFSRDMGRRVAVEEIESTLAQLTKRVGICEERAAELTPGFLARRQLVSAHWVGLLAERLRVFYQPWSAALCIAFSVLAIAAGLVHGGLRGTADEPTLVAAYLVYVASLFVHEFGHAAAAAAFGASVGDIGATLYLIYPALSTDVTAAWDLRRWQRVVVDLGGIYFQAGMAAMCLLCAWALHVETLRIAALMMLAGCTFALLPVFRSDGYWIVADALGVPNLERLGLAKLGALLGRAKTHENYPRGVAVATAMYGILTLLAWATLCVYGVRSIAAILIAFPPVVGDLVAAVTVTHRLPNASAVHVALRTLLVFLCLASLATRVVRIRCRPARV
jgi:putative peptide zinc metalloprotease protein